MSFAIAPFDEPSPLIVLHGLLCSSNNWAEHMQVLATDLKKNVYGLDMRNHGMMSGIDAPMSYDSMAEDVEHFIKSRGFKKTQVLGHSMSGKVAMQLALKAPELVERVVVVDTAPTTYAHAPSLMKLLQKLFYLNITSLTSADNVRTKLADVLSDETLRNSLLKNVYFDETRQCMEWNMDLGSISMCLYNMVCAPFPNPNTQGPTEAQVLFVKGGKSHYLNPEATQAAKKFFPKSEIVTIEGVGHYLYEELGAKESFTKIIKDFLR